VATEQQWTERAYIAPSHEEREAERREQKLVKTFEVHLQRKGHEVCRLKIVPKGEAKPLGAPEPSCPHQAAPPTPMSIRRNVAQATRNERRDGRLGQCSGMTPER
jgi:hypothetical protein